MAEHSEEIADPDCWRCATELADAAEAAGADVISTALHLFGVMYLCPTCGNKRCPKATDHRLDCTNSNEPGQVGSRYGVLLSGSPEEADRVAEHSEEIAQPHDLATEAVNAAVSAWLCLGVGLVVGAAFSWWLYPVPFAVACWFGSRFIGVMARISLTLEGWEPFDD